MDTTFYQSLTAEAERVLSKIESAYNFDLQKATDTTTSADVFKFSTYLNTFVLKSRLLLAHDLPAEALHFLKTSLLSISKNYRIFDFSSEDSYTAENILKLYDNIELVQEIITSSNSFCESFRRLISNNLPGVSEIPLDDFMDVCVAAADDVLEDRFSLGVYKEGSGIASWDDVSIPKISNTLVVAHSLQGFLDYITPLSLENSVSVIPFFKLEDHEAYCYFLFAYVGKGRIQLFYDAPKFNNLQNKTTTRNPYRHREGGTMDTSYLPYRLIDKYYGKNENTAAVSQHTSQTQVYFEKMSEQPPLCKLYYFSLTTLAYREFSQKPVKPICLSRDVTRKMITDGKTIPLDAIEIRSSASEEYIKELTWVIFEKSLIRAPLVTSVATELEKVSDWLGTPEEVENVISHLALTKTAETIRNAVNDYEVPPGGLVRTVYDWFSKLPQKDEKMLSRLFAGIESVHRLHCVNSFLRQGSPVVYELGRLYNKHAGGGHSNILGRIGVLKCAESLWDLEDLSCIYSDYEVKAQFQFYYRIRHWTQLCWLFGLKREDLPRCLQNFRAHEYVPYEGNSILGNVNPITQIQDKMSRQYSNGLVLQFWSGKNVFKKMLKKYNPKALQMLVEKGRV